MVSKALLLLAGAGAVLAQSTSYPVRPAESTIEPNLAQIIATQATQVAIAPVSNVKGLAFDRIMQIWLENIDYNTAAADANMQWVASQGITLSNFWAVTHPSEPNYCAAAGGDYFGMDNDDFNALPANISTIADLLDTKGISYAEYQEHLPYAGFEGFNYSNQQTYNNDYVRKHSPLVLYQSITNNATRNELLKNFTGLADDVSNQKLPQWSFVTPNMTNDAHDTNITFAGKWIRNFLPQYLNNSYFTNNTLIIVTFDETGNYTSKNNIFTVLLGGAVPKNLIGTTDSTFYTHYSLIATVSSNWGLPSLGRWDCGANILQLVANKTGYQNAVVDTTHLNLNTSYPGAVSDAKYTPGAWPLPAINSKCSAGNGVLPAVVSAWKNAPSGTAYAQNYTLPYPFDSNSNTGVGGTIVKVSGLQSNTSGTSTSGGSSSSGTSTTSASATAKTGAANANAVGAGLAVVFAAVGAAMML